MHCLKRFPVSLTRSLKNQIRRSLTSQPTEAVENETKEKNIKVQKIQNVTMIGINRPHKKNALDLATAEQLTEALEEFENDEDSKSGVLYGIGGNFCAGYDLHEIAKYDGKDESYMPQFGSLANRTEPIKKPLIACLTGYTIGIGLELALMCDLRVMEETAVVGFLNRRFGIPILSGGTVRLPALIGYSRAMDMILTGRTISAQEALDWGLANRITACGAGLGNSFNNAKRFVKFPQKTLLADRSSAYFATYSAKQMEEALQFERDNSSHLLFEEGVDGAKKFVTQGTGRHGKFHNLTKVQEEVPELDPKFL